jgi:hypothetical protein
MKFFLREVTSPKFQLGDIVSTANALSVFDSTFLQACLERHAKGDWGDLCDEDKETNDAAVKDGSQILSAYEQDGKKLWVISDAGRAVTTFLLPEDY